MSPTLSSAGSNPPENSRPVSLSVTIDNIPATGLQLEGQLGDDIFQLPETAIRYEGPLSYNLTVFVEDGSAIVSGSLKSPFALECTRCLTPFPYTVELPHYSAELPLENAGIVDLTDQIREDILLALPSYPKCEQATGDDRTCPQAGSFDGSQEGNDGENAESGASGRSEVWDILDQLPNSDGQPS